MSSRKRIIGAIIAALIGLGGLAAAGTATAQASSHAAGPSFVYNG